MCGIYGLISLHKIEEITSFESLPRVKSINHRGPDDINLVVENNKAILGHTRLSINDLEGGGQPIYSEHNDYILLANAEIYNSKNILDKASESGLFNKKSNSDCEALIAAYLLYGEEEMHRHIRGMYAFILYDRKRNRFIAARDHVGIKPLYFCKTDEYIEIASEAKALSLNSIHSPFENGTVKIINRDLDIKEFSYSRQYSFCPPSSQFVNNITSITNTDIDLMMKPFKDAFRDSVRMRFQSDVPICLFLSGGLDSAVLSSVINELTQNGDVVGIKEAFCVGRENSLDYYCAQKVAERFNWKLNRVDFSIADAIKVLPTVIYHLESDEPEVIRSSITNYFLAKKASDNYKVVLTGEGSDELFGGYLYFHDCPNSLQHHNEIVRIIKGLSHANLLRVDKMSMAHSLEARVPFLDPECVKAALEIPSEYKMIYNSYYNNSLLKSIEPFSIEKWILRISYKNDIPPEILNRAKAAQCEGYSETFTSEFQSALTKSFSHLVQEGADDPEAMIYTKIFQTIFNNSKKSLVPVRWPGNCRASDISWTSDKALNKGLAPSASHLRRGIS